MARLTFYQISLLKFFFSDILVLKYKVGTSYYSFKIINYNIFWNWLYLISVIFIQTN